MTDNLIYQPVSWFEPLDWDKVFPNAAIERKTGSCESFHAPFLVPRSEFSVHVDLGAGDGGFIRERAKNHPATMFLAVERLLGRVRKISKRCLRENLSNVRVLRIEAIYAVERLFPPESLTSITILFPDPWPKRRHVKNRIVQTDFLEACARVLRPSGWIVMKTDDVPYFEQMQEALAGCASLKKWDARAEELLPEKTDFEAEFLAQGKPIHFLAAKRV